MHMETKQKKFKLNEPSGQGGRYSKVERIFLEIPPGSSVKTQRVERFDYAASLLYSPVEYIIEDISPQLPNNFPDDEWITNELLHFIKGEFGSRFSRIRPDSFAPIQTVTDASFDVAHKYLEKCESELVYGGILQNVIVNRRGSFANAAYDVISAPLLGNPANSRCLDRESFVSSITPLINQHKRLQLIIPSFPFKDQNIFRTEALPDHVDLGEISLIIRLHTLSLAFFQIHPFGADWIILSDGVSYAKALGIEPKDAISYRENLRDIRNKLNLQGTVSILDLDEIAHFSDGEKYVGRFDNTVNEIAKRLSQLIRAHTNIEQSFSVLIRGIIWNLSTRSYEKKYSRDEIWESIANSDNVNIRENNALVKEIYDRGVNAALYYAAYNITLHYFDIPQCIFPQSFRGTVHPKKGQIAVPSLGDVYPWNGIPIILDETCHANDIVVAPWYSLRKKGYELLGHLERGNSSPLYYTQHKI
jgi:hypothetical protein